MKKRSCLPKPKGTVCIPPQILRDKKLTWREKVYLSIVYNFSQPYLDGLNELGCIASDDYIATIMNVSKYVIRDLRRSLERKSYLLRDKNEKGQRMLFAVVDDVDEVKKPKAEKCKVERKVNTSKNKAIDVSGVYEKLRNYLVDEKLNSMLPELTKTVQNKFLQTFAWQGNIEDRVQDFENAAIKIMSCHPENRNQQKSVVQCLVRALKLWADNDAPKNITPAHLVSRYTWETLLPNYERELGYPISREFNFDSNETGKPKEKPYIPNAPLGSETGTDPPSNRQPGMVKAP